MGLAVIGATASAGVALYEKYLAPDPLSFRIVAVIWVAYAIAVALGFALKKKTPRTT